MADEKSGFFRDLWDAITGNQDSDYGGQSSSGSEKGAFDPPSSRHDSDDDKDYDGW